MNPITIDHRISKTGAEMFYLSNVIWGMNIGMNREKLIELRDAINASLDQTSGGEES